MTSRLTGTSGSVRRDLNRSNIVARIQSPGRHGIALHSELDVINPGFIRTPGMGPETPRVVNTLLKIINRDEILRLIETYLQPAYCPRTSPRNAHNAVRDFSLDPPFRSEERR